MAETSPIPLRVSGHQRREQLKVKIKRLSPDAKLPEHQTDGSAGMDLYAIKEQWVFGIWGLPDTIHTGIAVEIPQGWVGLITLRSSLAKEGFFIPNAPGIVDSDYRGEIQVLVSKRAEGVRVISHGERFAQLLIVPCFHVEWEEVDELSPTQRGEGGFGSTG